MLRSRFLWKLYGIYAFLILLTVAIVGTLVGQRIEREALEQTERQLLSEALLLRELAASEPTLLQRTLRSLGSGATTRFTVIAADGTVVADSHHDPARMDNHGGRPEILELAENEIGKATRHSRTLGDMRMYLALRVDPERPELGYARTSLPLIEVQERRAGLRRLVILGTAIAALLALALSFLFARRITRPLMALTEAADRMAQGRGELELDVHSSDEIGRLARAFDSMSRQLRWQLATITSDRNQLTAILASMAEGVVAVDRNERVVHMNNIAGDLLGLKPEKVRGRPIWEVTRIPEISEALAETMGAAPSVERAIRLPGPNDRILQLRGTPLRDGDGALAGAVLVIDDVTQLRRLETMRRDFVANVSHELKTPVTAIRGFVETLLDDPEVPAATRRRFLERVRIQGERMSRLVSDLLSLSRLEAETGALELHPLDLRETALDSFQALRPNGEAKELQLEVALPDEPVVVMAEEEVLRQAFSNLVDNAIKYTPRGGRVSLRLECKGDHVLVEVQDNGPGIDLRHQGRIFERFYRVDKARSRELGGTGLGLAIVKHVVRVLGGTVTLDSTPGRGTIFRILLPKAPEDAKIPTGPSA